MRYFLIALLLAGCGLNPEYVARQDRDEVERYMTSCDQMGLKRNTREHQECSLRMYEAARMPAR